MVLKTTNGGKDSRSLLGNVEHPNNYARQLAELRQKTALPTGGVRSGGDPNFGFDQPSPIIADVVPNAVYQSGRLILGLTVTIAYDPPPDYVLMEAEIGATAGHPGFYVPLRKEGPFDATWLISNVGMQDTGTYAIRVRPVLDLHPDVSWSEWWGGITFDASLYIPAQVTGVALDLIRFPPGGFKYQQGQISVGIKWNELNPLPESYRMAVYRTSDNLYMWGATQAVEGQFGRNHMHAFGSLVAGVNYYAVVTAVNGPYTSVDSARFYFTVPAQTVPDPTGLTLYLQTIRNDLTDLKFRWDLLRPGQGATATATIFGGHLSAVIPVQYGSAYWYTPLVLVSAPSPGGTQALVQANMVDGKITSYTVIDPGSLYPTAPTITVLAVPLDQIEPIQSVTLEVWRNTYDSHAVSLPYFASGMEITGLLPGAIYNAKFWYAAANGAPSGYSPTITFVAKRAISLSAEVATSLVGGHWDNATNRWMATVGHTSSLPAYLYTNGLGKVWLALNNRSTTAVAQQESGSWTIRPSRRYTVKARNMLLSGTAAGSVIKDEIILYGSDDVAIGSPLTVYSGPTQAASTEYETKITTPNNVLISYATRRVTVGDGVSASVAEVIFTNFEFREDATPITPLPVVAFNRNSLLYGFNGVVYISEELTSEAFSWNLPDIIPDRYEIQVNYGSTLVVTNSAPGTATDALVGPMPATETLDVRIRAWIGLLPGPWSSNVSITVYASKTTELYNPRAEIVSLYDSTKAAGWYKIAEPGTTADLSTDADTGSYAFRLSSVVGFAGNHASWHSRDFKVVPNRTYSFLIRAKQTAARVLPLKLFWNNDVGGSSNTTIYPGSSYGTIMVPFTTGNGTNSVSISFSSPTTDHDIAQLFLIDTIEIAPYVISPDTFAGTVGTLTYDSQGRITAITAGAAPVASVTVTSPIGVSGGATNPNIYHLASGVTAGSYTNATITVSATGHITAASSGTAPVTAVNVSGALTSTGGLTPTIGIPAASALAPGSMSTADKTLLDFLNSAPSTKTSSFTADGTTREYRCNSASAITATLPAASGCPGREYVFKQVNTGVVTVAGTIDGRTNYLLVTKYQEVTLRSNGTDWDIIGQVGNNQRARYVTNTGVTAQSLTGGAWNIINYSVVDYDPCSLVTTGAAWKFTAAVPGTYAVKAAVLYNASTIFDLAIFKNGVYYCELDRPQVPGDGYGYPNGSDDIVLAAGDYIDIRANPGVTASLANFAGFSHMAICKAD